MSFHEPAAVDSDHARPAAIQVICLGSGGGPSEDNVSGFLVRSAASGWIRGSMLAMDAGSHLAAITRILENHLPAVSRDMTRADSDGTLLDKPAMSPPRSPLDSSPPESPAPAPTLDPIVLEDGPFAGLPLPHLSARANAAHIVRSHVATYLITHPHLDHLSGFAINTAAFHATSRPKTLAALPFTVDAIKKHIFNDIIWPNLTDEDGGVGFVTFQRLKEGGDIMVGEGEGRGYIEVCEGLGVKGFKISHGRCMRGRAEEPHTHRGSAGSVSDTPTNYTSTPRHSDVRNHHQHLLASPGSYQAPAVTHTSYPFQHDPNFSPVDSTSYFIRDIATSREILMFGDVEPDSISVAPRLTKVWTEAAHKVASGILAAIFIECSYPDDQGDAVLFGHLAPRHLIAELQSLAELVREEKTQRASERAMRKRKRTANGIVAVTQNDYADKKRSPSLAGPGMAYQYRRTSAPDDTIAPMASPSHQHSSALSQDITSAHTPEEDARSRKVSLATTLGDSAVGDAASRPVFTLNAPDAPLEGVRIVVMHVKDTMKDGPHVSELILAQLHDHMEALAQSGQPLGCELEIAVSGRDYWF